MTNTTATTYRIFLALLCLAAPVFAQEQWELGVGAGYGFHKSIEATNAGGQASVGFKPGVAFTAWAGNETNRRLGGEARYSYQRSEAFVSSGSMQARFGAESHAVHYDVIFNLAKRPAAIRPFLAAGAGIKMYRGMGREAAFQPLSNFVALTRTTQIVPLVSVGGGIKFQLSQIITLRVEVRDYASTFPNDVIAPVPNARAGGWMHNVVPLIGIGFRVGK